MDLYETKEILLRINKLKSEYRHIQYCVKYPLNEIGHIFLEDWLRRLMIVFSIGFYIYELIIQFHERFRVYGTTSIQKIFDFVNIILVATIIGLSVAVLLILIYYIIKLAIFLINQIRFHSKRGRQKKQEYISLGHQLVNECDNVTLQLKNSNVPRDYRNLDAVNWMINAYENKRGETYTQLINLYEQHLENVSQQKKIDNLTIENNAIKKELDNSDSKISQLKKDTVIAQRQAASAKSAANWANMNRLIK